MKKKIFVFALLFVGVLCFSACGKSDIDLGNYLIESRETLYTASDELYTVTFSSGTREQGYSLDGVVNEMVPFGVLTITRTDGEPLANDTYSYTLTMGENSFNGKMEQSSGTIYYADLEAVPNDGDEITVTINFTGYTFSSPLENATSNFTVDRASAISIANEELQESVQNIMSDSNTKIEVVSKVLKDYSTSDTARYYWYIGVVSTNGETLGILIDATTGEIISKKV